jgi:hypothetical protein
MNKKNEAGQIWKHYKGDLLYQIIAVAKNADDNTMIICYQNVVERDDVYWHFLSEFTKTVEGGVNRFEYCYEYCYE